MSAETGSPLKLLAALTKAKRAFDPVLKDRENDFFNSKYATLGAVLKSIGAALDDNGLTVVQTTGLIGDDGILLLTTLHHLESGESLVSVWPLHPTKRDPQGEGSALTYARRYALMTMFGLNAEDDDGNSGSRRIYDEPQSVVTEDPQKWLALIDQATTVAELNDVTANSKPFQFSDDDAQVLGKALTARKKELSAELVKA